MFTLLHKVLGLRINTFYSIYSYTLISYQIVAIGRVCANGLGDQGSVPGRVLPKIQK